MKQTKYAITIATLSFLSVSANADLITVEDNIGDGAWVQKGGVFSSDRTINGFFDINATLSGFSSPYTVNSASITFNISDDTDQFIFNDSLTQYGAYQLDYYTRSGSDFHFYHTRDVNRYFTEQAESIGITVDGGQTAYRASNTYSGYSYASQTIFSYEGGYTGNECVSSGFFGCYTRYYYYNYYRDHVLNYNKYDYFVGGDIIQLALNASAFADLMADGVIGYNMFASLGDANLISATLTMDVTFAPTPVPVPAAAWLFGSGLLGLIGVSRRKKAA